MTRTRRIYNKPRLKKAHRYILHDFLGLKEQVETGEINNPLRNAVHQYGFMYHPYAQLCMGRCARCRDQTQNQKRLRKIRKMEFRHVLPLELYDGRLEC